MKALILTNLNAWPVFSEIAEPQPGKQESLVSIYAAALNHRDLFIVKGQYAGIQLPIVPGSDGAGEWQGKRVVVYPALEWGSNQQFQGKQFRVLGMPDNGTFAERLCVPTKNIFPMPEHLSWTEAAALPLAGLTAWRTLFTRCRLKKNERILLTGIGGGVALCAMQFALAAGAEVWVTSGDDHKIETAVQMGAKHGENYRTSDWDKRLKQQAGGFDVIVDAAGGDGFAAFPNLCYPGGRIGFYGGTLGKVNGLSLQPLFWKQISMLGSTMGSPAEFKAMLAFVQQHEIVPVVDRVYELSEAQAAFERMEHAAQFGKIVLSVRP